MKIGFLPLYIKLYDDIGINRQRLEETYCEITKLFQQAGLTVVTSDFCRIKAEFEVAVHLFEKENVDAIVTWHAAYSPSLESIEALTKTELPIIVLDTTPTETFGFMQDPEEVNYNHGIHGVMDLCSMLKQYGKQYAIAAGYYKNSDCIERVCRFVRAAAAARKLREMKVGLVGGSFDGMGDFAVTPTEMKERFGVTVQELEPMVLAEAKKEVSAEAIAAEMALDESRYDFCDDVIEDEYKNYMASCLALRACLEKEGCTAFSVNFLNIDGVGTMPFLECCKAMERGVGYAGEGDALTAAFAGALLQVYPETGFVEIFCPDWNNQMLFLSHMGEINYRIADGRPYICRTNSSFIKGEMPYAGYARMKGGKGVYVNISHTQDDFQMLLAETEMVSVSKDNFPRTMRGWMRTGSLTTAQFLEALSQNGATHHSIFVYGAEVEELAYFGKLLNLKTIVIS